MTTTKFYRVRVYVGPVHIEHYGAVAHKNGLTNLTLGTEHIYGTIAAEPLRNETDQLLLRHRVGELVYGEPGHVTAWRDVVILGAE